MTSDSSSARDRKKSRRQDRRNRARSAIGQDYPAILNSPANGVRLDFRNGQAGAAVAAAVERFGRLDVVANVAGYGNLGSIEDTSIEDFRAQIDTNLLGPINLSKAAIPIMRAQGSGHILNFSSVGGRIGSTGRAPYSAAKFGVEGFSEVMVTE